MNRGVTGRRHTRIATERRSRARPHAICSGNPSSRAVSDAGPADDVGNDRLSPAQFAADRCPESPCIRRAPCSKNRLAMTRPSRGWMTRPPKPGGHRRHHATAATWPADVSEEPPDHHVEGGRRRQRSADLHDFLSSRGVRARGTNLKSDWGATIVVWDTDVGGRWPLHREDRRVGQLVECRRPRARRRARESADRRRQHTADVYNGNHAAGRREPPRRARP